MSTSNLEQYYILWPLIVGAIIGFLAFYYAVQSNTLKIRVSALVTTISTPFIGKILISPDLYLPYAFGVCIGAILAFILIIVLTILQTSVGRLPHMRNWGSALNILLLYGRDKFQEELISQKAHSNLHNLKHLADVRQDYNNYILKSSQTLSDLIQLAENTQDDMKSEYYDDIIKIILVNIHAVFIMSARIENIRHGEINYMKYTHSDDLEEHDFNNVMFDWQKTDSDRHGFYNGLLCLEHDADGHCNIGSNIIIGVPNNDKYLLIGAPAACATNKPQLVDTKKLALNRKIPQPTRVEIKTHLSSLDHSHFISLPIPSPRIKQSPVGVINIEFDMNKVNFVHNNNTSVSTKNLIGHKETHDVMNILRPYLHILGIIVQRKQKVNGERNE